MSAVPGACWILVVAQPSLPHCPGLFALCRARVTTPPPAPDRLRFLSPDPRETVIPYGLEIDIEISAQRRWTIGMLELTRSAGAQTHVWRSYTFRTCDSIRLNQRNQRPCSIEFGGLGLR